ncbi:MAG TPA: hypothetical protein VMM13_18010 [Euzebya sp.]|nr:hypothetical protein [Euzebya sp.]
MAHVATAARVAAATALVIAVLVVAMAGRTDVVVILAPTGDEPEALLLDDGTPAWASSRNGEVVLLAALTPTDGVIGGLVGWCADGRRFLDPHLGMSFTSDGGRYVGGVPGRLPPANRVGGLARFQVEVYDQAGHRDLVRVHEVSAHVAEAVRPGLSGEMSHGPPVTCRLPDRRLVGRDPSSLDAMADHAHLAGPLDLGRLGWHIADGWMRIGPDGETRWCQGRVDRDASCDAVPSDLALQPSASTAPVVTGLGDPLAVRVADGRIVGVAVLPSSTWVGSSLRGTRSHHVRQLGRDPSGSRLVLVGGVDEPCAGPAPAMSQAPAGAQVIYIDLDTVVDLPWAASPAALPLIGEAPVAEVVIAIDAVTCRALSITDVGPAEDHSALSSPSPSSPSPS